MKNITSERGAFVLVEKFTFAECLWPVLHNAPSKRLFVATYHTYIGESVFGKIQFLKGQKKTR